MDEQHATFSKLYHDDISYVTEHNEFFRKVLSTTPNMQLVVMSLNPGEEIGSEIHPYTTQFFRVESGKGMAVIDGRVCELYDGVCVIIPLNTEHNIINTSHTQPLKVYTIYSPLITLLIGLISSIIGRRYISGDELAHRQTIINHYKRELILELKRQLTIYIDSI